MRFAKLAVAFLYATVALAGLGAAPAIAAFGFSSFGVEYEEPYGDPPPARNQIGGKPLASQAGSRTDLVMGFTMNTAPDGAPDETVKDIQVDLPAGVYGDFSAVPFCTLSYLVLHDGFCDPAAQVGLMELDTGEAPFYLPIYNMETSAGEAGVLAANVFGALVKIEVSARTDGDYGLRANIYNLNQGYGVHGISMVLWGVPADPVNDPNRITEDFEGAPAEIEPRPFLSLPPRCDGPLVTSVHADSWEHPGRRLPNRSADLSDPRWVSVSTETPPLTGCDAIDFQPSLKARPTTDRADSPSGLEVELEVPQSRDPEGLATGHLRQLVMSLPEGFVISPAGANGLAACGPAEIGLTSPVGSGRASFTAEPPDCPAAARIGTAKVKASGVSEPLQGSVFVAAPGENPFGSLLSVYVVVEGAGIVAKLAGRVDTDPRSGRLAIPFEEGPQLPFERIELRLFGGALAPLRTPASCATYAATATMTPWSAPASGPAVVSRSPFAFSRPPRGSGCAASVESLPVAPAFEAGAVAPIAGARTPFVVNLRREDGSQRFSSLSFSPPAGLIAKLAGTDTCPDLALALAAARAGGEERSTPSCPAASEVGSVYVSAGAGPNPYSGAGEAYLAGPYKGAPLSLAAVIPALAGPFDLGTVVVRAALQVDPRSARISARTDPFPTILEGIPLDLRSLSIRLDKPGFTVNPTSCDPATVDGAVLPVLGAPVELSNRFQLAECRRLGFKPKLSLRLSGPTHRSAHPQVRVALTMPRRSRANLAKIALTLPKTAYLDSTNIGGICSRADYEKNTCPGRSVRGRAKVWSPLLDRPLSGPVYLRSSNHALPDLVASLDGRIHLDLEGSIDSARARLRGNFSVPDVPVSKVVLTLAGGRRGLLVNNTELCRAAPRATVVFTAHNGKRHRADPRARTDCDKRDR